MARSRKDSSKRPPSIHVYKRRVSGHRHEEESEEEDERMGVEPRESSVNDPDSSDSEGKFFSSWPRFFIILTE